MLHLLLFLSVLFLLPNAQLAVSVDITPCPIYYYGKMFSAVYFESDSTSASLCFNGDFSGSVVKECVSVDVSSVPSTPEPIPIHANAIALSDLEASYKMELPSITNQLLCEVSLNLGSVDVKFASFGKQTAMFVESTSGAHTVTVYVKDAVKTTIAIGGSGQPTDYSDISGCRDSLDTFFQPAEDISAPDSATCEKKTCSEDSEVVMVGCPDSQRCQEDGTCAFDSMCTVIGNTIIDFEDKTAKVSDRCKYELLSSTDLRVDTNFRERHLTTQSFLDTLEITEKAASVEIIFSQDGTVKVGGTTQVLGGAPTTYGGSTGELSKDSNGITYTGFSVRIVFDGNSAAITYLGISSDLPAAGLTAVCTDASSLSSHQDTTDSSCTDIHTDPDASGYELDCVNNPVARCDLLENDPFTPCHAVVDPAPYIEACRNILCIYPERDGFQCQFMVSYLKTCSDHGVSLDVDWFSLGCVHHKVFCGGETCLDHEYCGLLSNGRNDCFCRGDLSKIYRADGSYGGKVECDTTTATLTLYGCFLKENGINPTTTQLNDMTCMGTYNSISKELTTSFTKTQTCSAEITVVSSEADLVIKKYTNKVTRRSDPNSKVFHTDDYAFSFACCFDLLPELGKTFTVAFSSTNHEILVGEAMYKFTTMVAFDSTFNEPVTESTPVILTQKICVKISAEVDQFVLVTDSCSGVSLDTSSGLMTHSLIENGCAVDPTVSTSDFGEKNYNIFCFKMFQFPDITAKVKLTCNVRLCYQDSPQDPHDSCIPDCSSGSRRRRSFQTNYVNDSPALIAMIWSP